MRLFEIESDENAVYFAFINSNPPSFGYKRALDTITDLSRDSNHVVFINPTQYGTQYPLPFDKTLHYNKLIFRKTNFHKQKNIKNPIQALKMLSSEYSKIYFVTRDKYVKDYRRMYQYAESWGVDSFDIIGLGDSKRPLPTGTSKDVSINAVLDNDYDTFKSTIPSKNKNTLSNLFIDLRKELIDEKDAKVDANEAYTSLLALAKYGKVQLQESFNVDALGNKVYHLENVMDRFKDLKLVLGDKFKNISFGQDENKNYVIMLNTDLDKLQQYLEANEEPIKESLSHFINESITSGNVASFSNVIGEPIKRDIDYSFLYNIKKSNSLNKQLDAINYVLNNYGFIDGEVVNHIDKELE